MMGMTVVGLVAGTHLIEDLKVAVPYKVAVPITAEQMLRSKDLYRALNQGFVFKLDGGSVAPAAPTQERRSSEDATLIATLERDNKDLKRQLAEALRKNEGLQNALVGMNTHLDGVIATLGRIEKQATAPVQTLDVSAILQAIESRGVASSTGASAVEDTGVVGGETPMFVPEEIRPKDAVTNIQTQKTAQESSVSNARQRLKELRSKTPGTG